MNENYIIDAYAWIEYLIGSVAGVKVKSILEDEGNEIYTCAVTVAEVISKTVREGRDPETTYNILSSNSYIIDVDGELSKTAGILHAKMRETIKDFGLSDAYVLASSKKLDAKILTGDSHFKDTKGAIFLFDI